MEAPAEIKKLQCPWGLYSLSKLIQFQEKSDYDSSNIKLSFFKHDMKISAISQCFGIKTYSLQSGV